MAAATSGARPSVAAVSRHVVVVPGLGVPEYFDRFAAAVRARGGRCTVLDLPGLHGPLLCEPTVQGIASAAAAHVLGLDDEVLLVGHSTGSQAALHAARQIEAARPLAGLVLAGPTVAPSQRRLHRLALAASTAYRRDSPRQLVLLPELLRAARPVLELVGTALRDRPEVAISAIASPVTITAGAADSFAPRWWRRVLVAQAVRAAARRDIELPGSHNNPFTHADDLADLVLSGSPEAARRR